MIKRGLITLALILSGAIGSAAVIAPTAYAAACDKNSGKILSLKPWYYGLTENDANGNCVIKSPDSMNTSATANDGMQQFITRIILTVVEDLLQIVAYATVVFIIYGGFLYMTSSGAPDKAARGRKTVLNAAIGLFIAIASIGLVNFVGGALGL